MMSLTSFPPPERDHLTGHVWMNTRPGNSFIATCVPVGDKSQAAFLPINVTRAFAGSDDGRIFPQAVRSFARARFDACGPARHTSPRTSRHTRCSIDGEQAC